MAANSLLILGCWSLRIMILLRATLRKVAYGLRWHQLVGEKWRRLFFFDFLCVIKFFQNREPLVISGELLVMGEGTFAESACSFRKNCP